MVDIGPPPEDFRFVPRERAQDEETARNADIELLRKVMQLPHGRRFVWRLLERSHVFAPVFSTDSLALAYASGERAFGISLLATLLQHMPDLYLTAQNEARNG